MAALICGEQQSSSERRLEDNRKHLQRKYNRAAASEDLLSAAERYVGKLGMKMKENKKQ